MGWFLIGKKNGKKSRSKRTITRRGWDRGRTIFACKASLVLILVAGVVVGWSWGGSRLRASVGASNAPETLQVEFVSMPSWMPPSAVEEIRVSLAATLTANPFDRESLLRAAEAIHRNPWVERVHRVTRRPGGVIEVRADYRRGTALVRDGASFHLVDAQRVRLPYTYTQMQAVKSGLPIFVGVGGSVPTIGTAWEGEDLTAGLSLAAVASHQPWFRKIVAIDVSNHAGRIDNRRAQLKMLTALDAGTDPLKNPGIEWGRPPGEESFYEPHADWKVARVTREFARLGTLKDSILQLTSEPGTSVSLNPAAPDRSPIGTTLASKSGTTSRSNRSTR